MEDMQHKFDNLQEEMEKVQMEKTNALRELQQLKQTHTMTLHELKNAKAQLTMQVKINQGHQMMFESQLEKQEALKSVSLVSEQMRKKF